MTVSLAITAPQAEFRVARALEQRAIPHHIFKIRKQLAFRGRPVERILPAFPRYIFLRILFDNIYHHLLETVSDIQDFLRENGAVWRGQQTVLDDILVRADANGFLMIPPPRCRFTPGQQVIVRGESLISGYEARFERQLSEELAIVEQPWLGRMVSVAVKLQDLDPVPDRHQRNKKRRRHRPKRRNQNISCHPTDGATDTA